MNFVKSYKIQIGFRLLAILFFSLAFSFSIVNKYYLIVIVLFAICLLFTFYFLFKYFKTFNNDLLRFFDSIKYSDFSQSFTPKITGSPFDELYSSFGIVFENFQNARNEKEESARYLNTVVQHIRTGLIIYDLDGEIVLINNAAKKILNVTHIKNISSFKIQHPLLLDKLYSLKHGERALIKLSINYERLQIFINAAHFRKNDKLYKIASLFNIKSELEEKELETWQSLIRVLTHEIMNSATPISSLAKSLDDILVSESIDKESFEDLKLGLQTIQKRSDGLIHFLNNYRNLTKIPLPDFSIVSAESLITNVITLMKKKLDENKIMVSVLVEPKTMELTIDPKLIEQVLINLVLNAIDATKEVENKTIAIKAYYSQNSKGTIEVSDNGCGILEEVQDKIFIPFFTTKQEGSGIGLSLSRQIMNSHNGTITLISTPQKGTSFILVF